MKYLNLIFLADQDFQKIEEGIEHLTFTLADFLWILGFIATIVVILKFFYRRSENKSMMAIKQNETKLNDAVKQVKTLTAIESQVGILVQSLAKIETMLTEYCKKTDKQEVGIALLDNKTTAAHNRLDKIEQKCEAVQSAKLKAKLG